MLSALSVCRSIETFEGNRIMTDEQLLQRRTVLRTASGIALTSVIAGCSSTGTKAPKADVNYQDHPKNGQQCSGCQFFVPPKEGETFGKCTQVEGKIAPDGWCQAYSPK